MNSPLLSDVRPTFAFEGRAQRVLFGNGALAKVATELQAIGTRKALVLCTTQQRAEAERVADLLGGLAVGIFDGAVMHVPIANARAARAEAERLGADSLVAVGGGSTVGLGKAVALESGLPILCIPTTYAGSEMTPIFGLTEDGLKRTGRDMRVLPRTVIYDPTLTLALSTATSITSGINAIAHAAEGLYAVDGNPITDLMAVEGITALARALPGIHTDPKSMQARTEALYGAWLCGTVLGSVGMSLHHKLCHTLGGTFNLPHAETHSIVLPHALAYNAAAAPTAMRRIASALGAMDAPQALFLLAERHGTPVALKSIGMREEDLDLACAIAMQDAYANPRPMEAKALRALLQHAFDGVSPSL